MGSGTHTGRTPCEDRREAATSPGTPGAPRSWKRREGPSPGASGGSAALGRLDLRRLVSRTGINKCMSLKSSRLCYFLRQPELSKPAAPRRMIPMPTHTRAHTTVLPRRWLHAVITGFLICKNNLIFLEALPPLAHRETVSFRPSDTPLQHTHLALPVSDTHLALPV